MNRIYPTLGNERKCAHAIEFINAILDSPKATEGRGMTDLDKLDAIRIIVKECVQPVDYLDDDPDWTEGEGGK